jgi:hypothetical protein
MAVWLLQATVRDCCKVAAAILTLSQAGLQGRLVMCWLLVGAAVVAAAAWS